MSNHQKIITVSKALNHLAGSHTSTSLDLPHPRHRGYPHTHPPLQPPATAMSIQETGTSGKSITMAFPLRPVQPARPAGEPSLLGSLVRNAGALPWIGSVWATEMGRPQGDKIPYVPTDFRPASDVGGRSLNALPVPVPGDGLAGTPGGSTLFLSAVPTTIERNAMIAPNARLSHSSLVAAISAADVENTSRQPSPSTRAATRRGAPGAIMVPRPSFLEHAAERGFDVFDNVNIRREQGWRLLAERERQELAREKLREMAPDAERRRGQIEGERLAQAKKLAEKKDPKKKQVKKAGGSRLTKEDEEMIDSVMAELGLPDTPPQAAHPPATPPSSGPPTPRAAAAVVPAAAVEQENFPAVFSPETPPEEPAASPPPPPPAPPAAAAKPAAVLDKEESERLELERAIAALRGFDDPLDALPGLLAKAMPAGKAAPARLLRWRGNIRLPRCTELDENVVDGDDEYSEDDDEGYASGLDEGDGPDIGGKGDESAAVKREEGGAATDGEDDGAAAAKGQEAGSAGSWDEDVPAADEDDRVAAAEDALDGGLFERFIFLCLLHLATGDLGVVLDRCLR
ncbi:hypothetical protein K402DRAFT_404238 [Aulographum hederae CBS 113979]|uniref:Uncharacterized protein n=1 Tax=Aulographum hederae CBS 113979 TaxID=1176131 RepID=A0A6G1H0B4_9PEZI|nr:hypothetical protein K402DRAFT_404238 [Aulographum hederae CBS 113979]